MPLAIAKKPVNWYYITIKEKEVYADSAYLGIDKKTDAPKKVKFKIVKRLSTINKIVDENKCVKAKAAETAKCSVRAKVEHAFIS